MAGGGASSDNGGSGAPTVPPVEVTHPAPHGDPFASPTATTRTHRHDQGGGAAATLAQSLPTPLSAVPPEAALENLTNLIVRMPDNHMLFFERARLLKRQPSRLLDALTDINDAIDIALAADDHNAVVKYGLMQVEILYLIGRNNDADSQLKELLDDYVPAATPPVDLRLVLEGLNMLLLRDPTDLVHLSERAQCYEKLGKADKALSDINTYLIFAPKDLNTQLRKASLLRINNQPNEAIALLTELAGKLSTWADTPHKPQRDSKKKQLINTFLMRAQTYHDKAYKALDDALILYPEDPNLLALQRQWTPSGAVDIADDESVASTTSGFADAAAPVLDPKDSLTHYQTKALIDLASVFSLDSSHFEAAKLKAQWALPISPAATSTEDYSDDDEDASTTTPKSTTGFAATLSLGGVPGASSFKPDKGLASSAEDVARVDVST